MLKAARIGSMLSLVALLAVAGTANAQITFDEFPVGTVITNQYSPVVTFSPGPVGGTDPIIATDGAMPTSPVLSPNPPYAGDFWMKFGPGITNVDFISGYWDTVGTGKIDVYNQFGALIGNYTDTTLGIDAFTFSNPTTGIGWIYFNSVSDPAGADIDNLYATPEPGTLLLLGSGLVGLAGFARRRFSKK